MARVQVQESLRMRETGGPGRHPLAGQVCRPGAGKAAGAGSCFPENVLKAPIRSDPAILLLETHPKCIWTYVCKAWCKNIYECCLLTITQAVTLSSQEQGTEKINHAVPVSGNKDIEGSASHKPSVKSACQPPDLPFRMVYKLRAVFTFLNCWGKKLRAFCDS